MLLRLYRTTLPKHALYTSHWASFSTSRSHLKKVILNGFIGGCVGVVILSAGGYTVYHFSGAKKVVDTVKPAMTFLNSSRENIANEAPKQALYYLREACKAYVASIPFAGRLVDKSFDAIDDAVDQHGQEATSCIWKAYEDIHEVLKQDGNEHRIHGAYEVLKISQWLIEELGGLSLKASQPVIEKYELDKHAAAVSSSVTAAVTDLKSKSAEIGTTLNSTVEAVKSKVAPYAAQAFLDVKEKLNFPRKAVRTDNDSETLKEESSPENKNH